MPKIDDRILLPLPFFTDIEKQNRYKECGSYTGSEIAHNQYLLVVGCRLLPFQIKRVSRPEDATDFVVTLINAEDETETEIQAYIDSSEWDIRSTTEGYDYITYLGQLNIEDGGGVCLFDNCIYYIEFFDGVQTWYSELFEVYDSGYEDIPYRIWSPDSDDIRQVDLSDDRIYKTE